MKPSITDWLCLVTLTTSLFLLRVTVTPLVVKVTTHPALNNYGMANKLLTIAGITNACCFQGGNWFKFKPMVSNISIHIPFGIVTRFYANIVVTGLHNVYFFIGFFYAAESMSAILLLPMFWIQVESILIITELML